MGTRAGGASDVSARGADFVGRRTQHVIATEAFATDRAASVDTAIDPQECLEQLRALGSVLCGGRELLIEDLSRAP